MMSGPPKSPVQAFDKPPEDDRRSSESTTDEEGKKDGDVASPKTPKSPSTARSSSLVSGDFSLRPTETGFVNSSEPQSFLTLIKLNVVLIYNAVPAMVFVALWMLVFAASYGAGVEKVLDVLEAQPFGYAPLDFPYDEQAAPAAPPGPGPHGGDFAYGHRSDLDPEYPDCLDSDKGCAYQSTPSMSLNMMSSGYYSFDFPGHPMAGESVVLVKDIASIAAGLGAWGFPTFLFIVLYQDVGKKFGKRVWATWPVAFAIYTAQKFLNLERAKSLGQPVGGSVMAWGATMAGCFLLWKFHFKANYLMIGLAVNFVLCVAAFTVLPAVIVMVTGSGQPEYMVVIFRLILWPCVEDFFLTILRMTMRKLPADCGVDKGGITLACVPLKTGGVFLGRFIIFSLKDPVMILLCNVGLVFIELIVRCSVGWRDRMATRMVSCCNSAKVGLIFGDPDHQKFRANNTVTGMMIEYVAMVFGFVGAVLMRTAEDPGNMPTLDGLLLNLLSGLVLEIFCDAVSLWVEVNKLKLPIIAAWKARSRHFVWAFPALVCSICAMLCTTLLEGYFCPMRLEDRTVAWLYCASAKNSSRM